MHESFGIDVAGLRIDLAALWMITVSMIIVLALALAATRRLSVENPGKLQNLLEWVAEFVHKLIGSTMDMNKGKRFLALGMTLIIFIFVSNMLGLPFYVTAEVKEPVSFFGYPVVTQEALEKAHEAHKHIELSFWKSPTADVSVTMGLALTVIVLAHALGLRYNTRHYLRHYFEPNLLFFPLNVVKELSKLLTLGLRLFGNIYAGEVLIAVILMAGVAGIVPLIIWQGFSIFVGAIQAFVFTMLTMVYISQCIEHHHE
ncbi:MAG: ATP synthase F0 subunit A [Candidatus Reconcilbacillus cellulovorans]|uniref:ATP synthase subunit a n=1 Tax=Candidatus Reconcilbacillus cellulovorans TaxID=1906605 RepID=A0A2A6DZS7_9BACL|nr:MAG: ATP synthase F0 subunit A [Candidatus Reconcilbacillus cellulovorans]